jgi:hypothetical protein
VREHFLYFRFSRCTVGANGILGVDIRLAYIAGIVTVSYSGFFMVGLHSNPDPSFQWQPASIENTKVAAKLANPSPESSVPLLTDGASHVPKRALKTFLAGSRIESNARKSTLYNDVHIRKRELVPGIKARPI